MKIELGDRMLQDIIKIYAYREMLKSSVRKELRSRYKASVLGFLWTFLNPLLMLIVYSILFATVMKVKVPQYPYALFLFVGLVPWTFFATSVQQSTTTIISNSNLIKKINFPRIILPLSVAMTNLVNMLYTFIIVFIALVISKAPITGLYIYLPLIILLQTILILAFSIILSCLTVYLRDLEHIISILMMAWFYLTPIIFPQDYIPSKYLMIFRANPMMPLIDAYRDILMYNKVPDMLGLIYVFLFSFMILIIGYNIFNVLQKRFAEEI